MLYLFAPAPADGAARLQSAVSLVRCLSPDDPIWTRPFHQEPGTSSRRRCVPEVHTKLLKHEKVKPLLRTSTSGYGTHRSLGVHKSFKPKQAKTDERLELSRPATQERYASKHDRPKPSSTARRTGARPSSLTWAMRSWRTGTASVGGMVTKRTARLERRFGGHAKKQAKGSKRITVGEDKAYDTSDHIGAPG